MDRYSLSIRIRTEKIAASITGEVAGRPGILWLTWVTQMNHLCMSFKRNPSITGYGRCGQRMVF